MKRSQDRGARLHGAFGQRPAIRVRQERRDNAPSVPVEGLLPWWLALLVAVAVGIACGWISVQVAFFLLTLQLHS